MDIIVRIFCGVLLVILAICAVGNVRILLESNKGKKFSRKKQFSILKPELSAGSLIKLNAFFLMINHGPDLCKIEMDIENIPYYKSSNCLLMAGEGYDENEGTDLENV